MESDLKGTNFSGFKIMEELDVIDPALHLLFHLKRKKECANYGIKT